MKRTPKIISRKKRALRWIAIACVMLLWFNLEYHVGYLIPRMTVYSYEQRTGCGKTEVVFAEIDPDAKRIVYLAVNEHAMLVVRPELEWCGWQAGATTVDCSEERPLRGGLTFLRQDRGWEDPEEILISVPYAWGRVDDPNIVEVQVTYRLSWESITNTEVVTQPVTYTASTKASDWKEQDGSRYFLLRIEPQSREGMRAVYQRDTIAGLDAAGNVVVKYIMERYR